MVKGSGSKSQAGSKETERAIKQIDRVKGNKRGQLGRVTEVKGKGER